MYVRHSLFPLTQHMRRRHYRPDARLKDDHGCTCSGTIMLRVSSGMLRDAALVAPQANPALRQAGKKDNCLI